MSSMSAASSVIDVMDVEESQPHKGELCFPFSSRVICLNSGLNTTYDNYVELGTKWNMMYTLYNLIPNVEKPLEKSLHLCLGL